MALNIDFMQSYDRESIVAELKRIAAVTGKQTVSSRDINRFGRIHSRTVIVRFGSLGKANEAADLDASPFRKWTNEELLRVVTDLWNMTLKETGRSPIMSDLKKYGFPVSAETISVRFGTWRNALVAASRASGPSPHQNPERTPRRRSGIPTTRRFYVFKRDRYQCCICHRSGVELEIDHVIPVSRGGSNSIDNLQALCIPCNRGKSDSML